mgnify:CR=1 FL=1
MATGSVHDRYMAGMNQAKHRGVAVWFDQHKSSTFRSATGELLFENGRPYHSIVELKTKMPVGPVMPFGWEAPVEVPQQYIISAIGKATNLPSGSGLLLQHVTTDRIRINYEQMYTDDKAAQLTHWREAVTKADAMGWEPPKMGRPMDRRLIALVGPAPRDPRIAQALKAGNPWALGMKMPTRDPVTGLMRVEEDEELARLLLLNRSDIMTPDQEEREEESRAALNQPDVLAETRAAIDEMRRLKAELAEMMADPARTDAPKNKGGRPRKVPLAPVNAG